MAKSPAVRLTWEIGGIKTSKIPQIFVSIYKNKSGYGEQDKPQSTWRNPREKTRKSSQIDKYKKKIKV